MDRSKSFLNRCFTPGRWSFALDTSDRQILKAELGFNLSTSVVERVHNGRLSMNVNFFEWLRDGVRQSVLLGVSDAIEQIGTPANADELHPNVAALLTGDDEKKSKRGAKSAGRKRLGKSLKDMDTATT